VSKRGSRKRACETKRRYETADEARGAMYGAARRGAALKSLIAYRCKYCPGWHIGHPVMRRKRVAR
jgi:hypothetical protein